MAIARQLGPLGFIAPRRRAEATTEAINSLGIVTEGPEQLVSSLSGGNQQKVVMGRGPCECVLDPGPNESNGWGRR
jgi:simple sugar transport system ATP-binding protein